MGKLLEIGAMAIETVSQLESSIRCIAISLLVLGILRFDIFVIIGASIIVCCSPGGILHQNSGCAQCFAIFNCVLQGIGMICSIAAGAYWMSLFNADCDGYSRRLESPVAQLDVPGPHLRELQGYYVCDNTCNYNFDGECDDGSDPYGTSICAAGTDCYDCGPYTGSSTASTYSAGGPILDSTFYGYSTACSWYRGVAIFLLIAGICYSVPVLILQIFLARKLGRFIAKGGIPDNVGPGAVVVVQGQAIPSNI